MSHQLSGKVAVITGASSGIGAETARLFAREGAAVALGARREAEGEAVAQSIRDAGGRAFFLRTDVTDADQITALVERAVSEFGQLDIALNNAGTEGTGLLPILDDTEANLRRILDVNVVGVWHALRAEIPHLTARGGSIINVSSVAGLRGFGTFSAYAASKFAVEGLTRSVAQELATAKIRVNTIAPGPIETEMMDRASGGDPSGFVALVPMARVGTVSEIAHTALFLASDGASYVTGQHLVVDGGIMS